MIKSPSELVVPENRKRLPKFMFLGVGVGTVDLFLSFKETEFLPSGIKEEGKAYVLGLLLLSNQRIPVIVSKVYPDQEIHIFFQ